MQLNATCTACHKPYTLEQSARLSESETVYYSNCPHCGSQSTTEHLGGCEYRTGDKS
jgi:DNA-directed RNA polymerase subunit RPC12/RpoP